MVTKSEAIKTLLEQRAPADLAALYHEGMEVQVNVASDGYPKQKGEYKGKSYYEYTDDHETWKSFRIPWNADSEPEYDLESKMTFDLGKHAEGIGMTGWNWQERRSYWVAFDFDSMLDHAENHSAKLTDSELEAIKNKAKELDYVTIRKSTSGTGLHLYVFFANPPETANHTEHAALGRAVLDKISFDLECDLTSACDVVGANFWVWHRKYENSDDGLALIKSGTPLEKPPTAWKEHIKAVSKTSSRGSLPIFGSDEEHQEFLKREAGKAREKWSDKHKDIVKYIDNLTDFVSYINYEHNCLVTHTLALKKAHEDLGLKGVFETSSSGSTEWNCYAYPVGNGGFVVVRYGEQVKEAPSWTCDASTNYKTQCYYNMHTPIREAAKSFSGQRKEGSDAYFFPQADKLINSAKTMGVSVDIPEDFQKQQAEYEVVKDELIVRVFKKGRADATLEGWIGDNKKYWYKSYELPKGKDAVDVESETAEVDAIFRYVVDASNPIHVKVGYLVKPKNGEWEWATLEHASAIIRGYGYSPGDAQQLISVALNHPWYHCSIAFEEMFPGGRRVNTTKAKFAAEIVRKDLYSHPTWDMILNHLGSNLTPAIVKNEWCRTNDIYTGPDFLKVWLAYMVQRPYTKLPILFIYSPTQQTGKTFFAEAIGTMFTGGGTAEITKDMTGDFNPDFDSVFAYIEEVDLSSNSKILAKIKTISTASRLKINEKNIAHFTVDNSLHIAQFANKLSFSAIEPGDNRTMVILVDPIPIKEIRAKDELLEECRDEASEFLSDLFYMPLPTLFPGRMALPVVETEEKLRAMRNKETALDSFLRDECAFVPGSKVNVTKFQEELKKWIKDGSERGLWTHQKINETMPEETYPKGRSRDGKYYYCNLAIGEDRFKDAGTKLMVEKGKIINE